MTAPADTRISDEDLNELFADVTRDNKGRLLSYYNNETVLALITELRDRRAQAVTEPAAWRWRGPHGGWLYDVVRPSWPSEPVYASPPPAQSADAAKEPQAVAVVDALKRVRSRIAENPPTHWHNGKGDVLPAGDLRLTDPLYAASYNQPLYASSPAPASGGVSEETVETMWGKVVFEGEDNAFLWELDEAGNMDGVHYDRSIELSADTFPEGTTIVIREPLSAQDRGGSR